MRGIVIAGGFGTRLRPLTLVRPKPLIPIVNAPLLEYQLFYLKQAGIRHVCFATNYMAEVIEKTMGDGSQFGMNLVYAVENEPLDTGGAIRNAYDAFPGDDCVVFNGDVIHGFDIASILESHRQRGADVTLTLREVPRPHPYGVVEVDDDQRVTAFHEPTEQQKKAFEQAAVEPGVDKMNAGLYVINRQILESFPTGRSKVETDLFPSLIAQGAKVYADLQNGFWVDVGRPSQYLAAVQGVIRGLAPSPRPFRVINGCAIHPTAQIGEKCLVETSSSIGSGVKIGDGARISASVVMDGAEIGADTVVHNSIVDVNARVGCRCKLDSAIVEAEQVIESDSELGEMFR